MKLNNIGKNETEIETGGITVLFSYKTPVACHVAGEGFYKTSKRWGVTTSKHIGRFINRNGGAGLVSEKDQSFFDNISGVKP